MSDANSFYLPSLPDDAFAPLPTEAISLPGRPEDYRAGLFEISDFGPESRRDAAIRILAALIDYGKWAAIRRAVFYDSAKAEWERRHNGSRINIVLDSVLGFPDGPERIDEGVTGLCSIRFLGFSTNRGDLLLWPTPALLKHIRERRARRSS